MTDPYVLSIHTGKISPLGPDTVPSGFVKHSVRERMAVTEMGVHGDEQADLSIHGGVEKAVYAYSLRHYDEWQREYPRRISTLIPSGFGENLCVGNLMEVDICVGDVHRIGTCVLQVRQPHQPCFKLALRFGDKCFPKAMIRTGRAGWFPGRWRRARWEPEIRYDLSTAQTRISGFPGWSKSYRTANQRGTNLSVYRICRGLPATGRRGPANRCRPFSNRRGPLAKFVPGAKDISVWKGGS